MSSQMTTLVFGVIGIALILLVWWIGSRKKKQLTQPATPALVGADVSATISPQGAAALKALSSEPILVKQSPDGVRAQIDGRPMVPVVIFADPVAVAALKEAAAQISRQHGMVWVALVTVRDDDSLSATLLS